MDSVPSTLTLAPTIDSTVAKVSHGDSSVGPLNFTDLVRNLGKGVIDSRQKTSRTAQAYIDFLAGFFEDVNKMISDLLKLDLKGDMIL